MPGVFPFHSGAIKPMNDALDVSHLRRTANNGPVQDTERAFSFASHSIG
jgi:hypothetical protein